MSISKHNATYRRLYRICEKNSWTTDFFGIFKKVHVEHRFQPIFQRELEKEYFALYPRRRKFNAKKLSEDDVNRVRERVVPLALEYIESRTAAVKDMKKKMRDIAPLLDFTPLPEMYKVKRSSTSTYNSQGFGRNGYARKALTSDEQLLIRCGFTVEVRTVMWVDVLPDTELNDVYEYELWANAEPYMLDALRIANPQSMVEWAADQWKNGVNPAVYNPFLSNKDFDASLKLAGWD